MSRRLIVLLAAVAAVVLIAAPASGAPSPLARIKKLEKQVRGLTALFLLHDQVYTTTVEVPVTWNQNYGSGYATCPPGMAATGGGVRWVGPIVGIDSAIISSYNAGGGWSANVRAGAGTTAGAYVQAVCASLR